VESGEELSVVAVDKDAGIRVGEEFSVVAVDEDAGIRVGVELEGPLVCSMAFLFLPCKPSSAGSVREVGSVDETLDTVEEGSVVASLVELGIELEVPVACFIACVFLPSTDVDEVSVDTTLAKVDVELDEPTAFSVACACLPCQVFSTVGSVDATSAVADEDFDSLYEVSVAVDLYSAVDKALAGVVGFVVVVLRLFQLKGL